MGNNLLNSLLRDMENMPSLPITVTKVMEVTKDHTVSPHQLNKIISLDPVLTAKVLQLVNSAYYSLPTKVTSIVKAIILLGVNTIRNLALTSAIVPIVGDGKHGRWKVLKAEEYWKHCIGTGVTAKLIGKNSQVEPEKLETYFISGLLHDIGKVVLEHNIPEKYHQVIERCQNEKCNLVEVEEEILGLNHCIVGKHLVEKWKLSTDLEQVIEFHHNPEQCDEEYKHLVYSVATANVYCDGNEIGTSGNASNFSIDENILSYLKITEEDLNQWKPKIFEEIERAYIFINTR